MKKVALFATVLLALATCASAQTMIRFSELTPSTSPSPVPNGYHGLDWEHVYSVAPLRWPGSGPGFFNGPDAVVAFVGGNYVCFFQPSACRASIRGAAMAHFQVMEASVSAGYQQNVVTFIAYRGGAEVGRQDYNLTVRNRLIHFPSSWGMIDQLAIWPHALRHAVGSVVFYTLTVMPEA